MNLGRKCLTYVCSLCQQPHKLWTKSPSRSRLHTTTRSDTLRLYVSLYCRTIKNMNSYYSTDSTDTPELNEMEAEDMKKRVEDTGDNVSVDEHRVEESTRYEGRHFTREDVRMVMDLFMQRESVIEGVAAEYSLEDKEQYKRALKRFLRKLKSPRKLNDADTQVKQVVDDIIKGTSHVDELIPIFLRYARILNPLMGPKLELQKTSNMALPPAWFPEARSLPRKLIYHAGPTNSGKTHNALKHFMGADTAIYCAPLRMLAHEIYHRSNKEGASCDLLTGEESLRASGDEAQPAPRLSCTVEMANLESTFDVAVIDEIQMIEDPQRGGGWSRALLGLPAREVHLCGHSCAIDVVQRLAKSMGESLEVHHYERLSPLVPLENSLCGKYERVRPGDCVVAFSRASVFQVRKKIEQATKQQCAVIYGGLPPAVRVEQADKFNDPQSPCNILVATDAIGMGLNLNIRRIVFHTLTKFDGNERSLLSSGHVKQIAGRAGRYGKDHAHGEVTTFEQDDLSTLHELLELPVHDVKQAGLYPSLDQIELFSNHIPNAKLHEILALFYKMAKLDGNYFLCDAIPQIELASSLQGANMHMRELFKFSIAPVDETKSTVVKALVHFAYARSSEKEVSFRDLCHTLKVCSHQSRIGMRMKALTRLENMHEIIDLYLWLSMRFPGTFVASDEARELQGRIEGKISMSIHSAWYKKREGAVANGHGKGLLTTSVMGVKNSVSPELLRKLEELARSDDVNLSSQEQRMLQNKSRKFLNVLKALKMKKLGGKANHLVNTHPRPSKLRHRQSFQKQ